MFHTECLHKDTATMVLRISDLYLSSLEFQLDAKTCIPSHPKLATSQPLKEGPVCL